MCKIIEEMRLESYNEGRQEGRREGRLEGKMLALWELVKDGTLTVALAAQKAGMSVDEFRKFTVAEV